MAKTKKPSLSADQTSDLAALVTLLNDVAPDAADTLPNDIQIRIDVRICLLDAITDSLPVSRDSIGADTKPSDIAGLDSGGWGMCLARFELYLELRKPLYGFYVHKPAYTLATFDKKFSDTIRYLTDRIIDQFLGND